MGMHVGMSSVTSLLNAVLAVYQSARATTRTHNSLSGKCLPYVRTTNERQTYKPQLTSSSVGLAHARPNYLGMMEVVAWVFLCILAGAGFGKGKPGEQEPRNDFPNIVFMMADDMGYGDVGYNGGRANTPNLDAMAMGNNSILLTRYYSGGPLCSPTRGTVLTGRNHNRYCVWTANAGSECDDFECPETMPLPTSEITIADILEKNGYRTAIFGKWAPWRFEAAVWRQPEVASFSSWDAWV